MDPIRMRPAEDSSAFSAEFRLAIDRVQITRSPNGDLVIHPCQASA